MTKKILNPEAQQKELLEIKGRLIEIMIQIRNSPSISALNQTTLNECLKTINEIDNHLKNLVEPTLNRSNYQNQC